MSKNASMSSNQPNYAESAENFADTPPLQLTMRVMRGIFSNPRFWIGMAAAIFVLTIMGPFNTLADMTVAPRLVYWGGIAITTYPAALAVSVYGSIRMVDLGVPVGPSRLLSGALGGIPVAGIVYIANAWFAGTMEGGPADFLRLLTYTIPISAAVSVIYYLVESSMRAPAADEQARPPSAGTRAVSPTPAAPTAAFFNRLPVALGNDLISLQAQDHYVRATTVKGSEMILLRLSDAERELEGIDGIRVHRSWWLARKHIGELKRENEKWIAILSNGEKVPVSRSYTKQVRQWFEQ